MLLLALALLCSATARAQDEFPRLVGQPDILPPGGGTGAAFSHDSEYLAVAHFNSPYIAVYRRSGATFSKLPDLVEDPPECTPRGVAFSHGSAHLAVVHCRAPRVVVFARHGEDFVRMEDVDTPPTTADSGRGVAFGYDATETRYMAIAHDNSPFVSIYKLDDTRFIKLPNPSDLPTGEAGWDNGGRGVAFSDGAVYLAVAHFAFPYVTIYKRTGDTFVKVPDPATLPTGPARGVAFSPDAALLAVAHDESPYVTVYKREGDVFSKLPNPDVLPGGGSGSSNGGHGVAFSHDSVYLAVAHNLLPRVTVYRLDGDTLAKINGPTPGPSGVCRGVAFSHTSAFLASVHDGPTNDDRLSLFQGPGDITFVITVTAGEGGSVTPSGDVPVDLGNSQTFTVTPDPGYEIADVVVDGASVGALGTYTFSNVTSDHTIRATFTEGQRTLTVGGTVGGSVTTPGEGTFTYAHGTVVDLVAEAAVGYAFVGWTGDIDQIDGFTAAETTITMLGDYAITAAFEALPAEAGKTFGLGWYLMSVSRVGEDTHPTDVFSDVLASGQPLLVYAWPGNPGYMTPGEIDPGRGYWLYLVRQVTIEVDDGVKVDGDYEVAFVPAGWHLVSTPRWPIAWESVEFRHGGVEHNVADAIAEGLIGRFAYRYDAALDDWYVTIDLADAPGTLDPWKGYWLKTLVSDVTMVIPLGNNPSPPTAAAVYTGVVPEELRPPSPPQSLQVGPIELAVSNHPNPVNAGKTTFTVSGVAAERIAVRVFDLSGREIWRGAEEGNALVWEAADARGRAVPSGVYLYYVEVRVAGRELCTGPEKLLIVR